MRHDWTMDALAHNTPMDSDQATGCSPNDACDARKLSIANEGVSIAEERRDNCWPGK